MERVFRNGLWVGTGPGARSVQGDARVVDGVIVEIASEIDPGFVTASDKEAASFFNNKVFTVVPKPANWRDLNVVNMRYC